jgi:hypothetical protein
MEQASLFGRSYDRSSTLRPRARTRAEGEFFGAITFVDVSTRHLVFDGGEWVARRPARHDSPIVLISSAS